MLEQEERSKPSSCPMVVFRVNVNDGKTTSSREAGKNAGLSWKQETEAMVCSSTNV
jgi:hypothetical protein